LREPKFHLLTFTDGEGDHQREGSEIGSNYGLLLDEHVFPLYPHVTKVFGVSRPFTVLLRPDNYIGFISPETSSSRLVNYLKEVIGNAH
jgi:hypothetical protein